MSDVSGLSKKFIDAQYAATQIELQLNMEEGLLSRTDREIARQSEKIRHAVTRRKQIQSEIPEKLKNCKKEVEFRKTLNGITAECDGTLSFGIEQLSNLLLQYDIDPVILPEKASAM